MTYAEYFGQFTADEIRRQIDRAQASTTTATAYAERIHFILDVAAKDPVLPAVPQIDTALLNQILVYNLFNLDRVNFQLVKGKRNINLHSDEILDVALNDDYMMRSFITLANRRNYVNIVVITAVLYLVAMRKRVEANTLLSLNAELNLRSLNSVLEKARDMLTDCQRFGKGAYDKKVLQFLNQSRQSVGSVKQHKRAF